MDFNIPQGGTLQFTFFAAAEPSPSSAGPAVLNAGVPGVPLWDVIFIINGVIQSNAEHALTNVIGGWYLLPLAPPLTSTLGQLAIQATAPDPTITGNTLNVIANMQIVPATAATTVTAPPDNGAISIPQNTAFSRVFFSGVTGATFTAFLSKNGATFVGAVGAVTEVGQGWYVFNMAVTDTNTLGSLGEMFTSPTAPTVILVDQVITPSAAGVTIAIQRATAVAAFPFPMYSPGPGATLLTGLAVTGQRSLDGGAFVTLTETVAEIGSGWYQVSLTAAETNAAIVALRFSAGGAQDTLVTIVTQPQ